MPSFNSSPYENDQLPFNPGSAEINSASVGPEAGETDAAEGSVLHELTKNRVNVPHSQEKSPDV